MLIFYSASLPQFYFFLINVIFWGARGKVTTREVGPDRDCPPPPACRPFSLFLSVNPTLTPISLSQTFSFLYSAQKERPLQHRFIIVSSSYGMIHFDFSIGQLDTDHYLRIYKSV